MKTIIWTTPKGTTIRLELHTEKTIDCDGDKTSVPTWDLRAWAGETLIPSPEVKSHPSAGLCLNSGKMYAPIAADLTDDVKALVTEYWTEWQRRNDAARKADREYTTHHNRINRAMAE